jgi:hypothetical protein
MAWLACPIARARLSCIKMLADRTGKALWLAKSIWWQKSQAQKFQKAKFQLTTEMLQVDIPTIPRNRCPLIGGHFQQAL